MKRFRNRAAVLTVAFLPAAAGPAFPAAAAPAGGKVGLAELDSRTEKAIADGLRYLAKRQRSDGSWGGSQYRAAVTALTLMAFMLKGHFPDTGEHGEKLNKAVGYLIKRARAGGGYFGGNMYEHGLGTLALSEAWGMSRRKEIRDTLKKAVDVILRAQNPAGGWRYQPRPVDADISVTVMQIVALASAKEAGIYVPDKTIERATAYVRRLQGPSGGFGYSGPGAPGFSRSAAGVMSLIMCGHHKSKAVRKGLAYLMERPKNVFKTERFYYYGHYYAIQAMYQAGDAYYQKWYPTIRDALLDKQNRKTGAWSGGSGGGEYSTAMAILILGVPYRYLPIYQR